MWIKSGPGHFILLHEPRVRYNLRNMNAIAQNDETEKNEWVWQREVEGNWSSFDSNLQYLKKNPFIFHSHELSLTIIITVCLFIYTSQDIMELTEY